MKPIIGILGGMGPFATLAFYKELLDAMPAQKESDLIHTIIDSNPQIPSRTRAFLYNEESPVDCMIASAQRLLNAKARILTLPCNSAHYFLPEVERSLGVKFVNIIEETANRILEAEYNRVGVLAGEVTVQAKLYDTVLSPLGIETQHVSAVEQTDVRSIIEDVKNNRISEDSYSKMDCLLQRLYDKGCQVVILGCTELGSVLEKSGNNYQVIDSVKCLAMAAIKQAIEQPE